MESNSIEISKSTLRGLFLIMCTTSSDFVHAEVNQKPKLLMKLAHKEIIRLGKQEGFNPRGSDL